jgi:hypothetical protein
MTKLPLSARELRKRRADRQGVAMICASVFGFVALFGAAAYHDVKLAEDRMAARYSVVQTIGQDAYVVDHDLTGTDCTDALRHYPNSVCERSN